MERYIFKIFIHDRTNFIEKITENATQVFNTFLFGIRFVIKSINVGNTEVVNQIWVNHYSARIEFVLPVLMRGSKGIIIIFDCTNPMHIIEDLNSLPMLLAESHTDSIPVFLLGINSLLLNDLEYMHLERTIRKLIIPIPNAHYVNERNINISEPFFDNFLKIINRSFIYKEDLNTLIDKGEDNSKLFEIHRKNIEENLKQFENDITSIEPIKDKIEHLNLEKPVEMIMQSSMEELDQVEIDRMKATLIDFEKKKLDEMRTHANNILKKVKVKNK